MVQLIYKLSNGASQVPGECKLANRPALSGEVFYQAAGEGTLSYPLAPVGTFFPRTNTKSRARRLMKRGLGGLSVSRRAQKHKRTHDPCLGALYRRHKYKALHEGLSI